MTSGRFQSRGTLRAGSFYVVRAADEALLGALASGEYCCILAPRQVGKSSLRVRTERRLVERGVRCVSIDLNSIGSLATAEQWYFGMLDIIAKSLELPDDPADFWERHASLSPIGRWMRFLRDEVLPRSEAPLVLFLDEIDVLLGLPFSRDDFFAAVRALSNLRAEDPVYRRLTVCLFGVVAPIDLIANPERTPFNVGREIRVDDFTLLEARAFLPGLAPFGDAERLLDAVLRWTGGHPALSQRVCEELFKDGPVAAGAEDARVEAAVDRLFFERGRVADPILADVERRFGRNRPGSRIASMLLLYRRILDGEEVKHERDNPVHMTLRIAGLVSERADAAGARLVVRNAIFARVFDRAWVKEKEGERFLTDALSRWLGSGRQDDFVLRGKALDEAIAWLREQEDATSDEREFVLVSERVAQEHAAALEARASLERTAVRRRRIAFGLLYVLGILLAAVALRFALGREALRTLNQITVLKKEEIDADNIAGAVVLEREKILAAKKTELDNLAQQLEQVRHETAKAVEQVSEHEKSLAAEHEKLKTLKAELDDERKQQRSDNKRLEREREQHRARHPPPRLPWPPPAADDGEAKQ